MAKVKQVQDAEAEGRRRQQFIVEYSPSEIALMKRLCGYDSSENIDPSRLLYQIGQMVQAVVGTKHMKLDENDLEPYQRLVGTDQSTPPEQTLSALLAKAEGMYLNGTLPQPENGRKRKTR